MLFKLLAQLDFKTFNYILIGYILICGASSGYYQQIFWGTDSQSAPPLLMWYCLAAAGIILLLIKEIRLHRAGKKSMLLFDAVYIIPVIFLPSLPVRHDFALIFMLIYAAAFITVYILMFFKTFKKKKDKNIKAERARLPGELF